MALARARCGCAGGGGSKGKCEACESDAAVMQRKALSTVRPARTPASVSEVVASPGEALDPGTRARMERRFDFDFGRVRIHADRRAAESAEAVHAAAYTVRHHVAFGAGRYSPSTGEGERLLAHELAHVVQQSRGVAGAAFTSGDALERSADRAAGSVVGGAGPVTVAGAGPPALARGPLEEVPGNQVRVIPDRSRGKLRVVLVGPDGRIVAGLAEITPGAGEPLDPTKVMAYTQHASDAPYPQVDVQTPGTWSAHTNPAQDVQMSVYDQAEDQFHALGEIRDEPEVAALRKHMIEWLEKEVYHVPGVGTSYWETAPASELKKFLEENKDFASWRSKMIHARLIATENAFMRRELERSLGRFSMSDAEVREIYEHYNAPAPRTEWEKGEGAKLRKYLTIRHPRTGEVVAYIIRDKLHGAGSEDVFIRDINGRIIGGYDAGAIATYGPQDYFLDPLFIQALAGVAEPTEELEMVADVASGVGMIAKGTRSLVKGVRTARAGERALAGELTDQSQVLARAAERETVEEVGGLTGGKKLHISSDEVADAVERQTRRGEPDVAGTAVRQAPEPATAVRGADDALGAGGPAATRSDTSAAGGKEIVHEHAAHGHEYKVLEDGRIIRCSDLCADLRARFDGLKLGPPGTAEQAAQLRGRLRKIEAIQDTELKAKQAADLDWEFTQKFGPGTYMDDFAVNNMREADAEYQAFATGGVKKGCGYNVNGIQFDGYRDRRLIDAKNYGERTLYYYRKYPERAAEKLLTDARRQLRAADGWPIQWRVRDSEAADMIRSLFKNENIDIQVIWFPREGIAGFPPVP